MILKTMDGSMEKMVGEGLWDSGHTRQGVSISCRRPRPLAQVLPLTVLLVERNAIDQMVIRGLLEAFGYYPSMAGSALQALSWLHRKRFDLVLLDLQLPFDDMLKVSGAIRSHRESGAAFQLVGLNSPSRHGSSLPLECLELDGRLVKPIAPQELLQQLTHHC